MCGVHDLQSFYDGEFEDVGDTTTNIDDKIGPLEEVINAFINEHIPKSDTTCKFPHLGMTIGIGRM